MARPKNKKPELPEDKLPKNNDMTMDNLAKEGNALLSQEPKPSFKPIEEVAKDNPYIMARNKIFENFPWKKPEMERMEREGKTDCRLYMDFVKEVDELGNYFYNKQNEKKDTPQEKSDLG